MVNGSETGGRRRLSIAIITVPQWITVRNVQALQAVGAQRWEHWGRGHKVSCSPGTNESMPGVHVLGRSLTPNQVSSCRIVRSLLQ